MRAPMPVRRARPERINFAISRRCAVACAGCYSLFGQADPPREPFLASARAFADLGLTTMTLSGGDPLLLDDLPGWLAGLRAAGVRTLKLDTVGVGLLAPERDAALDAAGRINAADQLASAPEGALIRVPAGLYRGPFVVAGVDREDPGHLRGVGVGGAVGGAVAVGQYRAVASKLATAGERDHDGC